MAPNITSDSVKGIGPWSDDEIKRAIIQGISRDGHQLKPPRTHCRRLPYRQGFVQTGLTLSQRTS